jgi:lipopolysaccharide export system protein LptA
MLHPKSVRLTLVVLLLAGATAIAWNFLARRPGAHQGKKHALLEPQEVRSLTDAVYNERKAGLLRFEVRADLSVESASGAFSLKNVRLVKFDEQGKPANLVSSRQGLYDTRDKKISFSGDVRLRLADGTDVFSDVVAADLDKESVSIPERFRFTRGKAVGDGTDLTYLVNSKQVNVTGSFHLTLPMGQGQLVVDARAALDDLTTQKVNLIGEARIESAGNRLEAERIDVDLSDENKLEAAVGVGAAKLSIGADRQFTGQTITMDFDPASGNLRGLQVQGASDQPVVSRAIYQEQASQGLHRLEADEIRAVPEQGSDRLTVRNFTADGDVALRSEPLQIVDSRADHLVGTFASGGNELESADLSGRVFVLRRTRDRRGREQEDRLDSSQLRLRFAPGRKLREALALGGVIFDSKTALSARRLTARDSARVLYSEGRPQRVESKGDCRLEESTADGQSAVTAPTMVAIYEQGALERIHAEDAVAVTTAEKGVTRNSTSRTLDALYGDGELIEVRQAGGVRMREDQPGVSRVDVKADESRYDARRGVVTVTGAQRPTLRYAALGADKKSARETETTAGRIEFQRESDQIKADGAVKTVLTEGADLIVVQSGHMEADRKSGWAIYSEAPKIIQKTGSVTGNVVRYNSSGEKLTVEGNVDSAMTNPDGKKYRVLAGRLDYDRRAGRARYEGNVRAMSVDMDMKAPFAELILSQEDRGRVREVIAWGGVEIIESGRRATGQRAVYNPDTGKVVVTAQEASSGK